MSKEVKLSATRINSFLQCKKKYWLNYYNNLPKLSSNSFKLGLAVHEALELAGKIWLNDENRDGFSKKETKEILDKYVELSIQNGIEDLSIHEEGKNLVKSRLKSFLTGRKLISLEQKFGFGTEDSVDVTTDQGVPLIGAIDKLEEIDEDTIIVVDYKTSKTSPTADQLKSDIQLSIYNLVIRKLYPQYKRVILALDELRSDVIYTYRTEEELNNFSEYLSEVYKQMLSFDESKAIPSLNMFCPWCDYREYCDKYKEALVASDYKFAASTSLDDEDLINEWSNIKNIYKILENRKKELDMVIIEKIKSSSESLKVGEEEVYIRQNSRKAYDLDSVLGVVPQEDFNRLVNLNTKAVDKYIEDNPAVKAKIVDNCTYNYTTPFLATRKLKK